jgi:hypothetical protein
VLDLRRDPAPVLMVSIASERWADATLLADNVSMFIDRVESGTLDLE